MVKVRMVYMELRARLVSGDATEVEQWLQSQLDAHGDAPYSVIMLTSAQSFEPSVVRAFAAPSALARYGGVRMLSSNGILIAGSVEELDSVMLMIHNQFGGEGAQPVKSGRSEYPADGLSPETLIAVARSRLAPVTRPIRPRPRRPSPKRDPGG